MRRFALCVLLLGGSLAAVLPASAGPQEDALAKASEGWISAFNAGDAAGIATLMTEDGMILPPNGEPLRGRAAVRGFWEEFIATGVKGEVRTLEAAVGGELGYRLGAYRILDPDGEELDRGKFIEIWKRTKGAWLLHRDIWNSSLSSEEEPENLDEEPEEEDEG